MFVTQLKSFFMVARLGSITLAAKHLGLSQPTVTTQIRALEEHYGIELFRRQGGRLVVSDDGVRLLPMVDALLQQQNHVEFALRNAGDEDQGQLRIGAAAPYYILDIVKRFQQKYPRVDVVIGAGNSRQTGEALREFRVDLATSSHREDDARLLRVLLGADPLTLVVHRTHALARYQSVRVKQLAGCDLITREHGSMTREKMEEMLAAAEVTPQRTMEIASREAVREAIIRNMGVSVFAEHEASAHPELVVLRFDDEVPRIDEYLYCLKERREARLIAAFLAECTPLPGADQRGGASSAGRATRHVERRHTASSQRLAAAITHWVSRSSEACADLGCAQYMGTSSGLRGSSSTSVPWASCCSISTVGCMPHPMPTSQART